MANFMQGDKCERMSVFTILCSLFSIYIGFN